MALLYSSMACNGGIQKIPDQSTGTPLHGRLAGGAGYFPDQAGHEVAGQSSMQGVQQFPRTVVADFKMGSAGDAIELMQVVGQYADFEQSLGQGDQRLGS